MQISRVGSQPSTRGLEDWFTGTVRIVPLFQPKDPAWARAPVSPLNQALIITAGVGLVQQEGGPIEEVRPGGVVWFLPGLRHWHGATAATAMTHIAIQEVLNGTAVHWLEQVSDDQYNEGSKLSRGR